MAAELSRKLIHLSSLWMVIAVYALPKDVCQLLFSALLLLCVIFDSVRFVLPDNAIVRLWKPFLREEEQQGYHFSGATWMLLAATICVAFFDVATTFSALLVLIVSDSCAALVGKRWGSIRIFEKSLQGSCAFFVSAYLCLVFSWFLFSFPDNWLVFFLAVALLATITELFSKQVALDDNFTIALVTTGAISFLHQL